MSDPGQESIKMLERINQQLREAVLRALPCAFEQYVCISMPGTVIDTRLGGSYLPEGERATADVRNMIQVNEAMLTDSMVPLDKVMLGPTGKSVTRSYYTALDMLIPRKTDIGSVDVETDFNADSKSKYSQAMRFLRSKESILTPDSEIKGSKVALVKDKAMEMGIQGTVVDRYVEKQLAWSQARGSWDAVRAEASEARESRPEMQSASAFSARQKDIKRAQGELHARWMDWVVNGDKFRVDYCFALVDRDSIMARIERGKEATRDAMMTSIDGTEWAQVTLEPRHWATLCRQKALAWAERNPVDTEFLEMRLDNLRKMLASYKVYKQEFFDRSTPAPSPGAQSSGEGQGDTTAGREAQPVSNVQSDPDTDMRDALADIYKNEVAINKAKKETPAGDTKTFQENLVTAKENWLTASRKLSQLRTQADVSKLEGAGLRTMTNNINSHIADLEAQIAGLESKIAKASGSPKNIVLGVKDDTSKEIMRSGDVDADAPSSSGGDEKSADVWTKIKFDVGSQNDSSSTKESDLSGSFNLQVGRWWSSVKTQTTVSKSSKKVEKQMSACSVSGSFSAMLVTIRRPWLHADLFQDFDIDIPDGTKLSPGAKTMREWIENGDESTNDKRTNYGKFPAYPTAFVVAADTVLEFKSSKADSEDMMSSLSTDSSIQASYGPWGLKTGASVKTDNKESAQKMSVQNGNLRIEFQAPQIIGWVSEILPQLPRGNDSQKLGGLCAPPNMAFRANL